MNCVSLIIELASMGIKPVVYVGVTHMQVGGVGLITLPPPHFLFSHIF